MRKEEETDKGTEIDGWMERSIEGRRQKVWVDE